MLKLLIFEFKKYYTMARYFQEKDSLEICREIQHKIEDFS